MILAVIETCELTKPRGNVLPIPQFPKSEPIIPSAMPIIPNYAYENCGLLGAV